MTETQRYMAIYNAARDRGLTPDQSVDLALRHCKSESTDIATIVGAVAITGVAVTAVAAMEVDDALGGIPSAAIGGALGLAADILDVFW